MSKPTIDAERRATAWHEAGHAVAAVMLGIKLRSICIEPDDDAAGCCETVGIFAPVFCRPAGEYWYRAADRVMLLGLAGLAAQRLIQPEALDEEGCGDEVSAAAYCMVSKPESEELQPAWERARDALIEYGRLRAAQWVREHRDLIAVVAEALIERGALTGGEVREIIRAALRE